MLHILIISLRCFKFRKLCPVSADRKAKLILCTDKLGKSSSKIRERRLAIKHVYLPLRSHVLTMRISTAEMEPEKSSKVHVFDSEEGLSVELAKYTTDLSETLCKERGTFSVVFSGGSLIKSLSI